MLRVMTGCVAGSLARAAYFLLTKQLELADAQLYAVTGLLGHPLRLWRGRRRRAAGRAEGYAAVRTFIPHGRTLLVRIADVHENPEIFAEPERFDPSRFLCARPAAPAASPPRNRLRLPCSRRAQLCRDVGGRVAARHRPVATALPGPNRVSSGPVTLRSDGSSKSGGR